MAKATNELMGPTAASHVLGVSARTVVNWARSGLLPAIRTTEGRHLFRVTVVDQLARQRSGAAGPTPVDERPPADEAL